MECGLCPQVNVGIEALSCRTGRFLYPEESEVNSCALEEFFIAAGRQRQMENAESKPLVLRH